MLFPSKKNRKRKDSIFFLVKKKTPFFATDSFLKSHRRKSWEKSPFEWDSKKLSFLTFFLLFLVLVNVSEKLFIREAILATCQ
jgi:hypothetical protein